MKISGNVFILGDSYSTFEGFVPNDYPCYYTSVERDNSGVTRVEQTWWHQWIKATHGKLARNCSYSGSTICKTGYEGADRSDVCFIGRLDRLIEEKFFEENLIDTFLIFGGTNDSWANSPVGELQYGDWTNEDLYSVLPAFCYLLDRVKTHVPNAEIICLINTELKPEIEEGLKNACREYNVSFVQLENITKNGGHAKAEGMTEIKEQLLAAME